MLTFSSGRFTIMGKVHQRIVRDGIAKGYVVLSGELPYSVFPKRKWPAEGLKENNHLRTNQAGMRQQSMKIR